MEYEIKKIIIPCLKIALTPNVGYNIYLPIKREYKVGDWHLGQAEYVPRSPIKDACILISKLLWQSRTDLTQLKLIFVKCGSRITVGKSIPFTNG